MDKNVVKRDGRIVPFNPQKIYDAIIMAMKKTEQGIDFELANKISNDVRNKIANETDVESIQDLVERKLMGSSRKDVATVYINYRHKRNVAREAKTKDMFIEIVNAKANDVTRENANMNADTPAGMMMKFASETTKPFVSDYLLSDDSALAHKNGYIHIHDMDYMPTKSLTCLTSDTHISLKTSSGDVINTQIKYLDKYFNDEISLTPKWVTPSDYLYIKGRNGWTKLTGVSRRLLNENDTLYKLKTHKGIGLSVTDKHLIPVINKNGEETLKMVSDIEVGDSLLQESMFKYDSDDMINVVDELYKANIEKELIVITNISKLDLWLRYKYGISSLCNLIKSNTYRYGKDYITVDDYKTIEEKYIIPQEVKESLSVKLFGGKDSLPLYINASNELAAVIGYLHSDGSISYNTDSKTYSVTFINYDELKNERFEECFSKIFSNHIVKRFSIEDGIKRPIGRLVSSKLLSYLFKYVLGHKNGASDISIPNFIMNASDEIKWHYISALIDGDGCLCGDRREISYASCSKSFLEELNILLKSLGVESSIYVSGKNKRGVVINNIETKRNYDSYSIRITGYDNIEIVLSNLKGIKQMSIDVKYAVKPLNCTINNPCEVINKYPLEKDGVAVYDIETVEHWYSANGYIVHNCLQHPLDKILENGFFAGHGESRPAKRIETASILGCISLETVQNEMHGGQAIPAIDFYFAPYVRKSYIEEVKILENVLGESLEHLYNIEIKDYIKKDIKELKGDERHVQHCINRTVERVHQSMEAFIHNLNTIHSRGGNQVVFSSINYGTDTSAEGRCVIREMLHSTYKGVGNSGTAIFPIQIWKKKRGVNFEKTDPNYDLFMLACKVSARRFFPNFINLDAPFNTHEKWDVNDPQRFKYEPATMGCRTRVYENRFGEKTSIGRGNISFSTINIVRIAIECMNYEKVEDRIEKFYEELDKMLDLTALQLHERFEFQKTALVKQFPLLMSCLWEGSDKLKPTDTIESVINQGTLGIGFIGLAECLIALTGKHHAEDEYSQKLGVEIISRMKEKVNEYCEQYQHNYSVLATPAEGLSGRFTRIDKQRYGVIKGITDKEYYTNSNHVPVYYNCTVEHKAKIEAPYHALTGGGHIFYVEIDGDATHNPDAIVEVVNLMDKYDIGYGSVNHTRARCLECGYETSESGLTNCPKCKSTQVTEIQRITGYLVGTTDRWNGAKQAELHDRVVHD